MDKRKRVTVLLACALIVSLCIPSALAATTSTSIAYSSKGTVSSKPATLSGKSISGSVKSKSSSVNTYGSMTGYLYTSGSVFTIQRDSATVKAGKSGTLAWSNSGKESGTFHVSIYSPGGHNGSCSATS